MATVDIVNADPDGQDIVPSEQACIDMASLKDKKPGECVQVNGTCVPAEALEKFLEDPWHNQSIQAE